jgi:hypothetical protein
MKIKVLKSAHKRAEREICPWMISVGPENSK